jgi:hypothetical protein
MTIHGIVVIVLPPFLPMYDRHHHPDPDSGNPDPSDPSEQYSRDLADIYQTLKSRSESDICKLRLRLRNSEDEVRRQLGGCLSEIFVRRDRTQAEKDAYEAAQDVVRDWRSRQQHDDGAHMN